MSRGDVAAAFMRHLCECQEHGYSWDERFGDASAGTCVVESGGQTGEFYKGDRDCSSAVIDAWSEALRGTAYDGAVSGASYTGNMRSVFVASGLFVWGTDTWNASPGDVFLNEADHTAMCLGQDEIGEFSIDENGGCHGGQRGDQTGWESSVHVYYDFPWDGVLHYNGAADCGCTADCSAAAPQTAEAAQQRSSEGATRYRVKTLESGWLDWMEGLHDTGGSSDDYAGVEGERIMAFECDRDFALTLMDGTLLFRNKTNDGGDRPVRGITLFDDARYQAHFLGHGWGKVEHGSDDGGAGDDIHPLDMVRIF